MRSLLQDLETRVLDVCGPPGRPARAAVTEQRAESKLRPFLVGDDHQQKLSAGLQHAGGFGERLVRALAIQVIDRVGADDRIEAGRFKGQLSHISRRDGRALIHTGGLEVREQPLLRRLANSEVLVE